MPGAKNLSIGAGWNGHLPRSRGQSSLDVRPQSRRKGHGGRVRRQSMNNLDIATIICARRHLTFSNKERRLRDNSLMNWKWTVVEVPDRGPMVEVPKGGAGQTGIGAGLTGIGVTTSVGGDDERFDPIE